MPASGPELVGETFELLIRLSDRFNGIDDRSRSRLLNMLDRMAAFAPDELATIKAAADEEQGAPDRAPGSAGAAAKLASLIVLAFYRRDHALLDRSWVSSEAIREKARV